jgi:hypothetical protein
MSTTDEWWLASDRFDGLRSFPDFKANTLSAMEAAKSTAPKIPTPPPPPPPSAPTTNWQQLFEEQRRAAALARQKLESEYSSRRDELRSQYQFAETEQEKAQLAFLMAELDAATQRADQSIVSGYAYAIQSIQGLQAGSQAATGQESQSIENLFLSAGSQYGNMASDVQQRVGLQAGLAGDAYAPIGDFYSILAADQAREAAMSQRMGGVVGAEMTDAQRRMAFQQASQQADLQRQSSASGAQTRADQQAAVSQRIARERLDFVNQLRQLQSTYATLGAGFDQAGIESYGQQANIAASEAMMREQLASQERMSNASISARLREMEAQWAREDGSRPEWQTPELARALLNWDLLTDIQKTQEAYDRILGPFFGTGTSASTSGRTSSPGSRTIPPRTQPLLNDTEIVQRAEQIQARNYYEQQVQYWTNSLTQAANSGYYSTNASPSEIKRRAEEAALAATRRRYSNFTL